jgi:Tol biopolymer transport system component
MTPQSAIAHYRLGAKLGEGGMGAVYRATDTKLGREVAIKVLPDSFAKDPDRMARFTREAQVLASLNHPNIAAIYGVEERALILELVDGAEPKGPLSEADTLALVQQFIDALEYAHEHGVVHRDLKPANLKLTPEGKLKVLDFGLAKAMGTDAPADTANSPTMTMRQTVAGVIMGTAGYMSPEQARGARVDHRSDIWALGAVLFELLTGRRAFSGDTISDTIASVLTTTPDLAGVPEPFRKLISRCLERDLRKRLGWIGEARIILAETPAKAPPVGRRSVLAIAAAGVAGVAAGGVGAKWMAAPSRPAAIVGRFRRLTTDTWAIGPAISPDGKLVAYFARRGDSRSFDLWVQQVGGGSVRLVEALPIGSRLAFSADGSSVYFFAFRNPPGIYQAAALGGEPVLAISGNQVRDCAPSPDGKWLAYCIADRVEVRPVSSGTPRTIASGVARTEVGALVWSPDSTKLLIRDRPGNLLTLGLDGTTRSDPEFSANLIRRGFSDLNVLHLLSWTPNDDLVFTAARGEATNVWKLPYSRLSDGEPAPLTQGAWRNESGAIAGNRLVFANMRLASQVWALPVDWKTGRAVGELSRITPELLETQFPDVHPDGKALVYVSVKNGRQGIESRDLATGKVRQILSASEQSPAAYSMFSPDGKQIAFGRRGRGWPAYIMSADGGDARHVGDPGGRIRGWSSNGQFLLIWLVEGRKSAGVGVLDIATGALTEILPAGSTALDTPRFSPDGRRIIFVSQESDGPLMWIAPFRGARVVPRDEWVRVGAGAYPTWAPDGKSIFHLSISTGDTTRTGLARQPLDDAGRPSGPRVEVYNLDGLRLVNPVVNTMCASRDRLFLLIGGGTSDIWMMEMAE